MARTDNLWINRAGNYMETSSPDGYNILINGEDRYINFRLVSGSLGYGFRDNNGTLQFKHSGGAWTDVAAGGGSGDVSNFELELARKATGNSYMEFTETGGDVTNVDYWTDSSKGTKLFSKVITWSGGNPTVIVVTDEVNSKVLTTTIDWSVPANPKVTKVVS